MAGIVALVNDISNDVNAKLLAAGLPALTDGGIVIGRVHVDENVAPPRVILIPRGSRFEPKSSSTHSAPFSPKNSFTTGVSVRSATMTQLGGGYSATPTATLSAPDVQGGVQATATPIVYNGAIANVVITNGGSGYINPPTITISDTTGTQASATANLSPNPQTLSVLAARSLMTEVVQFECQVWTTATTPDPNNDFDATQLLYQQVIASTHLLAAGVYKLTPGKWADSVPNSTQVNLLGHVFVFGLELSTPLTDQPLQFAPVGTQMNPTFGLIPFAGGTAGNPSSG